MSATSDCNCNCQTPAVVSVPGVAGESAFATLTVGNTADVGSTTFVFSNTGWIVLGMVIILSNASGDTFTYIVTGVDPTTNQVTMDYLDYATDGAVPATLQVGTKAVVGGPRGPASANPIAIANGGTGATTLAGAQAALGATPWAIGYGGTGATTKATAQTALGLGQDPLISTVTGLSQAVTASATQVAGSDVTMPAAGNWLVGGQVAITVTGATFAASRTVTVKVRNTTQGVDVVTTTVQTGIITTATNPDQVVVIPPVNYSGGSVNDHLQIFVSISVINSAGTYAVASATLCAVPLRKS